MLHRLALLVALALTLSLPERALAQGDAAAAPAPEPDGAAAPAADAPVATEAPLRIAIVVEGEASRSAVEAARRLEAALLESGEIVLPSDEAVRDALLGARGTIGDGLEDVRGIRRRVGWGASADREALDSLASHLDLVAVVVVRGGDEHAARVFDANAHRYFQGAAVMDAETTGDTFVLARIRRAGGRRIEPVAQTGGSDSPLGPTDEAPEQRSWMRRNWPFVVAGVLLAGATTFFVMQRHDVDTSAPVIHVRPASP